MAISSPAWLNRDIQRQARWFPDNVKQLGLDAAFDQRWRSLPDDIQANIAEMDIPNWLLALVPMDADQQAEILHQFGCMTSLTGEAPANPIAARAEQLLIFGGSAQLPTPGDNQTGASLGPEGCTAAVSKYLLAQLKAEFPQQLQGMSDALTSCQSSVQMQSLFQDAERSGVVTMQSRPFAELQPDDFQPGSITIAQKPGGTHVFAWTRVPALWRWEPSDMMAIGNTGLPQYGDRMILAQEFVTGNLTPAELQHDPHGPINAANVIYDVNGEPNLSDPRTNVYAVKGSNFILVRFAVPAVA